MATQGENLCSLLWAAIEAGRGSNIAVAQGQRTWTYDQLADTVARLATALATLGLVPGDRIAVYMRDSPETVAAILGTAYAGMIAVPISELARPSDARDIINDSGAVAAITSGSLEPALDEIRSEALSLREVLVAALEPSSRPGERDRHALIAASVPADAPVAVAASDPALILYSLGARATDGAVRGVVHTHASPRLAFQSMVQTIAPMTHESRVFSTVRLSTAYGLGFGLFFPLTAGCQIVLLAQQPHSEYILKAIELHQPTMVAATPSVYRQLAQDVIERGLQTPLAGIQTCIASAEDMPSSVIDKVEKVLGVDVTVGYGLTEAFQFVVAAGAKDGREGACGRPLPGFEVRIVDDEHREVGNDEIGTLEIRGPVISPYYFGESTRLKDSDGWLTTRDRFMRDVDGYFYHCGRVDNLFKTGGKWVAPDEVERALLSHEAVWECAVIGVNDEDGLIRPLAYIVANIGHQPGVALEKTLRDYVKNEIAPYKYPRWIEFVDELPKGPSGKLLRYKLHEHARGGELRRRAETASEINKN